MIAISASRADHWSKGEKSTSMFSSWSAEAMNRSSPSRIAPSTAASISQQSAASPGRPAPARAASGRRATTQSAQSPNTATRWKAGSNIPCEDVHSACSASTKPKASPSRAAQVTDIDSSPAALAPLSWFRGRNHRN